MPFCSAQEVYLYEYNIYLSKLSEGMLGPQTNTLYFQNCSIRVDILITHFVQGTTVAFPSIENLHFDQCNFSGGNVLTQNTFDLSNIKKLSIWDNKFSDGFNNFCLSSTLGQIKHNLSRKMSLLSLELHSADTPHFLSILKWIAESNIKFEEVQVKFFEVKAKITEILSTYNFQNVTRCQMTIN